VTLRDLPPSAAWQHRSARDAFDVTCELAYDSAGLVADYPGLAGRVPQREG
jgi:hypothetical protein